MFNAIASFLSASGMSEYGEDGVAKLAVFGSG